MSDDLLRRLDEWANAKHLQYLPSLGREAAARIRELEADDAYVALKRNNDDLRERVERAEAERDAAKRLENVWCSAYRECDKDRDALRRDNEALRALRALLREAREDWIKVGYGASHEDVAACRDVCDRIDAALKESP